jgi:hypothetical protein
VSPRSNLRGIGGKRLTKEAEALLDELYAQHGELTEEIVEKAARPKNSPLHDYFEWDDNEAAYQYRLQQARGVIIAVTVTIVKTDGEEIRKRIYASQYDPSSVEPIKGFRRIEDLEEENPGLLLRTMQREWKGFYNRWGDHKGFWSMINKTYDTGEV